MTLKILLFDDNPDTREVDRLLDALKRELQTRGTVCRFTPSTSNLEGMYEQRLAEELRSEYTDTTLIVADLDLSATDRYRGLSEETVRRVAYSIGTPECAYARGEKEEALRAKAGASEAIIAVSVQEPSLFAKQVVTIASGFSAIADGLPGAVKGSSKKTIGYVVAELLGKPEYAEKISLYASGDQNRFASLLAVKKDGAKDSKTTNRRLACVVGYWLWDSILRYPGVVVNAIAASSYLDIHKDNFQNDASLQQVFATARYTGPFADALGPLWWRGMLDDLVADGDCADGRRYAEAKLKVELRGSECCEDARERAGYYCVLSHQPVSLKNSRGGVPWLPRGADLARISKSKHDEDAPWL